MDKNELKRLEVLRSYEILDTVAEYQYDSITRLASYICKTPIALITLIDEERQWIKSKIGMGIKETPRNVAFCAHTIQTNALLEVKDTLNDPRFSDNPFVTQENGIRYYAGYPLTTPEGENIGSLCVLDVRPNELDDDQKEALRILSLEVITHLNVSKKNRELEQMLATATQYNHLYNNSNEIHCITDKDGKIEYVNQSLKRLLGYSAEEAFGKILWEFCCDGERERLMPNIYKRIERGEKHFDMLTKVLHKNGEMHWMEWSTVIMDNKWLINGRDVTEKLENETALNTLSLVVEKSSIGVIIRNADCEIEWLNKGAEHLLGYKLGELKGKRLGDLLVGEQTSPTALTEAKENLKKLVPYELEMILYSKDSTPMWFFVSNNPVFNDSGELLKHVAILVDIRERKHAEDQLIKTREDAIKLSKAKENFLSVMSHEMRTPLNAVIGVARILNEEEPLERQVDNLKILNFSAQNLLTLINNVLDFTKIETGSLELESISINIRELVRKTVASLQFQTLEKDIQINYFVSHDLPELILGDPTRLYQIFINLLGNSVKFTERGEVKLSVYLEEETLTSATIKFEVTDTGIGIPQNKIHSIFDAYTQVDADTSRKYGGTGLGLAITQKLISLHQSAIKVESTLGKGSKFTFSINFLKTTDTGFLVDEKEIPLKAHILVVDDNTINRMLAKKALQKWEIETDFAEDGLEAINKIKAVDYDMILMDIHMPVMGGVEATKIIRALEDEKYKKLPIIALTGSVPKQEHDNYALSGMDDFVLKPFEPSLLYRKIKPFLTK